MLRMVGDVGIAPAITCISEITRTVGHNHSGDPQMKKNHRISRMVGDAGIAPAATYISEIAQTVDHNHLGDTKVEKPMAPPADGHMTRMRGYL